MRRDLRRLFAPRHVAVIGGGAWCSRLIIQMRRFGYRGTIHPVHPQRREIEGLAAVARIGDLPHAPDAAFIGVNRDATIEAVEDLAAMGAGGAVCFASGFSEAEAEIEGAGAQQARLVRAAGDMPILGPNCYGFVNALDGALLWPDQHGCTRVERGVALLTQSSNIAINLTMQRRGLPIAYMVTCGNMAQTSQAEIAAALLDDERVTAIGLHVEGFGDTDHWVALARKARERGIPLVALKLGRSDQARRAALSHTASLAGADAGAQALLGRLGIARVGELPVLLETLKLLHHFGPLPSRAISSVSCSGGEAGLVADMGAERGLTFPPLAASQRAGLATALGPRVALSNPLDYHTYIGGDDAAMAATFSAISDTDLALTMLIVDYPHTDASDWACTIRAAHAARAQTGARLAVVSTLPELMPDETARQLLAGGVISIGGLGEALCAAAAAATLTPSDDEPPLPPGPERSAVLLDEGEAKRRLADAGLAVPRGVMAHRHGLEAAAQALRPPLALKSTHLAHKTESGGVALNLSPGGLEAAAKAMPGEEFLIEEMVLEAVAEVQVGVLRDPAHGFLLTLAAGGILSELLADSRNLLVPSSRAAVRRALGELRIAPLLAGYRGRPAADLEAVLDAIEAIQAYVLANADRVEELEINPLICTPSGAFAADALLREAPE